MSVTCVLQECSIVLSWVFEKILLVMVMVTEVTVNDGNKNFLLCVSCRKAA